MQKAIVFVLLLGTFIVVPSARSQSNNYKQTNLTSDTKGIATFSSPNLVNPWGAAHVPGDLFLIADNNTGKATLHDSTGNLRGIFMIPAAAGSSNPSRPTGVAANTSGGFKVGGINSEFLFATEDGTISGWHQGMPSAMLAVDNSRTGAAYKGLALVTQSSGAQVLLAANFRAGIVEGFDSNFAPLALQGAFRDPMLPAGFTPFGIHVVGTNQVVVTFAQQDAVSHDAVKAPGAGFVSLFDAEGNFVNHIASQAMLNAPWGAAIAPAGFGQFEGALLIGNVGDGTINAFDRNSLAFLGQLKSNNGNVIMNPSLRELVFASTVQTGSAKTLFITAGLTNQMHGLFAGITPDATTSPSFSLSASPSSLTVARGSSGTVTITATAMNGFTGTINGFACSGEPVNSSCTFSAASLMPTGTTTDSLTLTLQTKTSGGVPYGTTGMGMWLPLSSMGMFGLVVVETRRRKKLERRKLWRWLGYGCSIALLCGALLFVSGCGGYSSSSRRTGTPPVAGVTVTVTGVSGMETESTTFSLTVQ